MKRKTIIKVRIKVPKMMGTLKAREITKKLEIYAKELIKN